MKTIFKLCIILAFACALTSCSSSKNKNTPEISVADRTQTVDFLGMTYVLPEEWATETFVHTTSDINKTEDGDILATTRFQYIAADKNGKYGEDITIPIANIYVVKTEAVEGEELTAKSAQYNSKKVVGENSGYSYVLAYDYNGDLTAIDDKPELKENYNKRLNSIDKLAENITFTEFDPQESLSLIWKTDNVITFDTKTIEGEAFTTDYLKKYDVTFINFWGTYCHPDIEETETLGELSKALKEAGNVGFFQVVIDTPDEETQKLAAQIKKDKNVDYISVMPDTNIAKWVSKNLEGVPTSVIVDKNGQVISDPIKGLQSYPYYMQEISAALKEVEQENTEPRQNN